MQAAFKTSDSRDTNRHQSRIQNVSEKVENESFVHGKCENLCTAQVVGST